jgi:hypothetical protein
LCPVTAIATRSGTPALHQIPHRCSTEVVSKHRWTASATTGALPRSAEVTDAFAAVRPAEVDEQERGDSPRPLLESDDAGELLLEQRSQLGSEVHNPRVVVLRHTWMQSDRAGLKVDVPALESQYLALDAPAERVLDGRGDLKVGAQLAPDRLVLRRLEESLPWRRLSCCVGLRSSRRRTGD